MDDDWGLSSEDLDKLERDAIIQLSLRSQSSSQPTTYVKVDGLPSTSKRPPIATASSTPTKDDPSKKQPRKLVKLALHATGNISATFPYDQTLVAAFRSTPKSTWNGQERLWMFPVSSLSSAEKILSDISIPSIEVTNLDPLVRRALIAASAVPDLRDRYDQIPFDIEEKLLPFQRDGVRFILQHGGRVLLADEMGLGKTLQAIAVTSCIRESWPVLILCPSSLRLHWASMIHQWLRVEASDILVVLSQSSGSNKNGFNIVSTMTKKDIKLDGMFNIVSYDSVTKLQHTLMSSDYKVVVADESHFLKNAQAKRTMASIPILQKAQYAILLSGTPALSRPIELFKQLEALYPDVYSRVKDFGERYCKGGVFGTYQGASNLEELHTLMKTTVMIRRLKKDVLTELPMKRRQQVFLDLGEKELKNTKAIYQELEIIKNNIKSSQSKEEVDSLKFKEKHLLNKMYTESAEAKIPAVIDYLGTVIEAGCKFLIFAHHQPMVEAIHQFLIKKKVGSIRIDGSTNASARQSLVADFQEKESIKAGLLSIKAGGVGLTLTAASTVIFAELSWTPGDLIQAEDRAHRIGQVSSVNVYYLLANYTIDDIIWDAVQNKLENLGQVLDGEESCMEVARNSAITISSKQRTLDSFMKRCNSPNGSEAKSKCPRF
ncbi:hypothetical protein Leryth_007313 [Lithospermum erythrorhizon]|nr:hypothetical protein Leryth_007313 [Lithospermum erythrorhizon]